MKCEYVKSRLQELKNYFKLSEKIDNEKSSSIVASGIVVLMSGIYEDVIEHLFIERVKKVKDT